MSTYDLKLTDHRCQLTTTTYYLLQFDLIWWEKKKNFWRKFEKKRWLKKEQTFCMIWLPKLLWWPKLTTNLYKKFWWQVRLYYCKFSSPINQLTKKILHQNVSSQNKREARKWHLKTKNRKNLNCMIQHLIVSEFI